MNYTIAPYIIAILTFHPELNCYYILTAKFQDFPPFVHKCVILLSISGSGLPLPFRKEFLFK